MNTTISTFFRVLFLFLPTEIHPTFPRELMNLNSYFQKKKNSNLIYFLNQQFFLRIFP